MRLRQIEVFHAVYTTGSISAAARSLHVSQPSVSKVLHHTQYQLGFELFKLVRGRLVATDEAHALFVEVKDIYDRLLSLQKAVTHIRDIGGGHIRLAVVPSLGQHVVPAAITQYRRQHPEVTFDVQTLHHDGTVGEGELGVASIHDAARPDAVRFRINQFRDTGGAFC